MGTVTSSSLLPASGPSDDRWQPVALGVDVQQRLTPPAQEVPDQITLIPQWQREDGRRMVDEGTPWLEPGDQVWVTIQSWGRWEDSVDHPYSTRGPWLTYPVVDGALADTHLSEAAARGLDVPDPGTTLGELVDTFGGSPLEDVTELLR